MGQKTGHTSQQLVERSTTAAATFNATNMLRSASAILLVVMATLISENLMAVEEAEYRVVEQFDNIEIREYAPAIIAEVTVEDNFEDASNKAFRKLFKYISGNNVAREKIAIIPTISDVTVELVFDPPWNASMMSDEARLQTGMM